MILTCFMSEGYLCVSMFLIDFCPFQEYPEYCAYKTPLFFSDDWLNMYLDKYRMHTDPDSYQEKNEISCSDYRFVYMGAKGWGIDAYKTRFFLFLS